MASFLIVRVDFREDNSRSAAPFMGELRFTVANQPDTGKVIAGATGHEPLPRFSPDFTLNMLNLSTATPIGEGDDRVVYQHPETPELCIKIARLAVEDITIKGFRDTLFLCSRFGNRLSFDYNYIDERYARYLKTSLGEEGFKHLPRCHGYIDTDLGKGVVWQHIHDFDGSPSLSLRDYYLAPSPPSGDERTRLWHALDAFFSWQIKHAIMLREMAYTNTLVCRVDQDTFNLYHIDAIGCVDLIPLATISTPFARLRVRSKVRRFRNKMVRWLGPPP